MSVMNTTSANVNLNCDAPVRGVNVGLTAAMSDRCLEVTFGDVALGTPLATVHGRKNRNEAGRPSFSVRHI